ncbi:MAG: hypothetical protein B0W54_01325 [Cellvibrio sp. 79]|nr:MAG: hypothetical protein B0W54_01325 [Cellvibrio sp. 79]
MEQPAHILQRKYLTYIAVFNGARAYVNSTVILFLVDVAKLPIAATALLLAVDLIATFFAEIPTGLYADKIGRHRSFVYGCGFTCFGFIVFASLPWWANVDSSMNALIILAAIAEAIASIGFAFQSGSLDAWVVTHLRARGDSSKALITLAHGQTTKNIAYMLAGIAGIAHYYLVGPDQQLLSTFSVAAMLILGLTLFALHQEKIEQPLQLPSSQLRSHSNAIGISGTITIFKEAWAELINKKKLLLLILAGATCYTLVQLIAFYWPYLLVKEMLSSTSLGTLGLIISWLVAYGFRALGNYATRFVTSRPLLLTRSLILSVVIGSVVTVLLCLLTGTYNPNETGIVMMVFATLLYGLVRLTDGFADPIRQWFISESADSERLATMFSIASFFALGVSAVIAIAVAQLLDQGVTVSTILITAAVFQLCSVPLYFYATKH